MWINKLEQNIKIENVRKNINTQNKNIIEWTFKAVQKNK